MNEFDQFVKHKLHIKHYLRYADDFVILSIDRKWLKSQSFLVQNYLTESLNLSLHPQKIYVKTFASGVDFLGWKIFTDHKLLRSATKRRMFSKIKENPKFQSIQSYLGLLSYGNTKKLRADLINSFWLNSDKDML